MIIFFLKSPYLQADLINLCPTLSGSVSSLVVSLKGTSDYFCYPSSREITYPQTARSPCSIEHGGGHMGIDFGLVTIFAAKVRMRGLKHRIRVICPFFRLPTILITPSSILKFAPYVMRSRPGESRSLLIQCSRGTSEIS